MPKEYVEQTIRAHGIECFAASLHDLAVSKAADREYCITRISGYSALGKSTVARRLSDSFPSAVIVPTDSFMLDRAGRRARGVTNGDDPQTINFAGLRNVVDLLTSGRAAFIPIYNHHTGKHDETKLLIPSPVIIIEGASALYAEMNLAYPSINIFLDADDETKIKLRHDVNVAERGYTEKQFQAAIPGYLEAYRQFIQPSMKNAHYICTVDQQRKYMFPQITRCVCQP